MEIAVSYTHLEIYSHYWKNEGDTSFHLDEDIDMPLDDPFFDIDYSADGNEAAEEIAQRKGQLWINQRVKALYDVDKFVYSVWSPPAYMKSNGSDSEGNLKSAYYQKFADYLSAFCDAYSSVGLKPVSYTHLDVYKRQGVEDSSGILYDLNV